MTKRERERLGSFIITGEANLSQDGGITCAHCGKLLATHDKKTDGFDPAPKQLLASGAVPVPNFGWFCSQACGDAYSAEFDVQFARDADGKIFYY